MTIWTLLVLSPKVFLYAFPEKTLFYDIQVEFDGNVPVSLFQGSEQKVKVEWSLSVTRKESPDPDLRTLSFQVTTFALSLWDPEERSFVKMPFGLESVREFFPDAEVYVTQNGAVRRTTAPRLEFPVRLPGLDSQHIPDVTFLLLEFPKDPVEKGFTWSFTRPIPEAPLECTATYQGEDGGKERFGLTVKQKYVTLEDGNYNVVGKKEDARVRVESEMRGTGVVEFSGEKGIVTRGEWQGEAVSRVVPLDGKEHPPTRNLKIKCIISLRPESGKDIGG